MPHADHLSMHRMRSMSCLQELLGCMSAQPPLLCYIRQLSDACAICAAHQQQRQDPAAQMSFLVSFHNAATGPGSFHRVFHLQRPLLMPFRVALLKLSSQEAAQHMALGQYETALPIAMDAVKEGQDLFKPQPDLRLFPLFLLGAQVCAMIMHICCHKPDWLL